MVRARERDLWETEQKVVDIAALRHLLLERSAFTILALV